MKDLVQCAAARDDFQRWLDMGKAPITVCHGEKADMMLLRLEKKPSVNYLYRTAMEQDNAISWDNSLTFCGVYDMKRRALYLTRGSLRSFTSGEVPIISEIGPSMTETISGTVNQRVEDTIANDRRNLPMQEITSDQIRRNLLYYQKHGAKEEAIRLLFDDKAPDEQFHSDYQLEELPEAAFMAYLQDPEGFIQSEAEQHIKCRQEKFLSGFLENDALLEAYRSLMADTENPIHRMKSITDAVRSINAKNVTVTVQKDGQELTFKTAARSLTGPQNFYSAYDISAQDRREFERLFGRHSNYTAGDIIRLTYGRNTIYEAPTVQTDDMAEAMGPTMQMGGM